MARPLRINRPGAWYHVRGRGIERRIIYLDDRDRLHWLELAGEAAEMFHWRFHAYTLMDNHFHAILQPEEANLSEGMQWFNTSYASWFNRRHQRVGPLFQGRFKSEVVEASSWGLRLSQYLHLNPVRIKGFGLDKKSRKADQLGLRGELRTEEVRKAIDHLRKYRWSSYRAYLGLVNPPPWLCCDEIFKMVGGRGSREQQIAYRKYVEDAVRRGVVESPWEELKGQLVLGSKKFVDEVRKLIKGHDREQPQRKALENHPELSRAIKVVEAIRGEEWQNFRDQHGDWGRDLVLYLGRKVCGMKLKALGEQVGGMDYAAVSGAVRRLEKRLSQDRHLKQIAKQAKDDLLIIET